MSKVIWTFVTGEVGGGFTINRVIPELARTEQFCQVGMEGHRIQIFGDRTNPADDEFNVIKERRDLVEMGSPWLDMAAWD